ncbi:MAG: MEKHLA domain-containing protein [Oscillatoria sp. Prado101]|jgi:hypothetical protein|nr:MEKHLA domain-containing protein [Oscillatoria sp. Prado101]
MSDGTQLPWQDSAVIIQSQRLLRSFQHWTGKVLLDVAGEPVEIARALFEAPFVLASHGMEPDPIFYYGNRRALELWELDWEQFTRMPSRQTAEPVEQEERYRILAETASKGFVSNYRGVRISSTGKRFFVEDVIVWNVLDEQNQMCGQAAVIFQVHNLS